MYKCKYFKIKELVNPAMLSIPENILWLMFDDRVLRIADQIREWYGECTVNTAVLEDCGLRAFNAGGAVYSQHKYGRALDIHILAIEKSAHSLAALMLERHLSSCVKEAINNKDESIIDEISTLFKRYQ